MKNKILIALSIVFITTAAQAEDIKSVYDTFDLSVGIQASLPADTISAIACMEVSYRVEEWESVYDVGSLAVGYRTDTDEHCSALFRASLPSKGNSTWSGTIQNTEYFYNGLLAEQTGAYLTQYRTKIRIRTASGLDYISNANAVPNLRISTSYSTTLKYIDQDGILIVKP